MEREDKINFFIQLFSFFDSSESAHNGQSKRTDAAYVYIRVK